MLKNKRNKKEQKTIKTISLDCLSAAPTQGGTSQTPPRENTHYPLQKFFQNFVFQNGDIIIRRGCTLTEDFVLMTKVHFKGTGETGEIYHTYGIRLPVILLLGER